MIIHRIHDTSNEYVISLMEAAYSEITNPNYIKNYHPSYKSDSGNLFFVLDSGRFAKTRGCYYVMEDNGEFICSAGWNEYQAPDYTVALLMTRMYTLKKHRAKFHVGNNILPLCLEDTSHYEHRWSTLNRYNEVMYKWVERINSNKSGTLGEKWPEIYKNFKPVGMKTIYHVEQFVVEYVKP